jgi:AraC-like DNA-binding protein
VLRFEPRVTPVEELVFRSRLVWIGRFRCPPDSGLFVDSGPASAHLFVFPRTSVRIQHLGRDPFVTSRNMVTFYNPGDEFRRTRVSPEGDHCDWFAIAPELAAEVVRHEDPKAAEDPACAFRFDHGPSDARTYYQHRLTLHRAAAAGGADPLYVEEAAVGMLRRLVRNVYAAHDHRGRHEALRPLSSAQQELVEAARVVLAADLAQPLSLDAVARAVGCSVYHLCRIFRRGTGSSLHAYRNQLRLRRSLDLVAERPADLTGVALDLGYSSHSHFTHAFRQAFGAPPARFRAGVKS